MSSTVTITWPGDAYADAFRELHAEARDQGYLSDAKAVGLSNLIGAGSLREPSPGICSYCGDPIRRVTAEDKLDPGEFEWTHEGGGPICGIPAVASP